MGRIYNDLTELTGRTPIMKMPRFSAAYGLETDIYAKLEMFNPAGSAKDRVALAMIRDAEEKGILKNGSVIVEPTSGNTGIGLAAMGAALGYRVILTMPETMSAERRMLLKAYGAEIVLTDGSKGMAGAIEKAREICSSTDGAIIPSQFDNPANPYAHRTSTAPEIWEDTNGKIDIFVAGVGTGGTLSGTGAYLKEKNPNIKIAAVEPASSPMLSQGRSGTHKIQGIGANFVPKNFDKSICDEIITVTDEAACTAARQIVRTEGLLAGISSGAAAFAAAELAKRPENKGKFILALLPDTGERYLSTGIFD
ncbi:MAG: cysteine synthase A [Oscillospiraceae bacterium]|nr:cysteine synthase A [Oscillospiraceae bacterium]